MAQDWRVGDVHDYTQNGSPDILWRNLATGESEIWKMNGLALTGADASLTTPDVNWQMIHTQDMTPPPPPPPPMTAQIRAQLAAALQSTLSGRGLPRDRQITRDVPDRLSKLNDDEVINLFELI